MLFKQIVKLIAVGVALLINAAANAQQGQWPAASDQTAKSLIDMERQWAKAACTHSNIERTILADDFQGTSPDGKRYSKAEAVEGDKPPNNEARECRLNDARVHFFVDNMAVVYGSESYMKKTARGKSTPEA